MTKSVEELLEIIEEKLEAMLKEKEDECIDLKLKLHKLQKEVDTPIMASPLFRMKLKKIERLESLLETEMKLGERLSRYVDEARQEKAQLQESYDCLFEENEHLKEKLKRIKE